MELAQSEEAFIKSDSSGMLHIGALSDVSGGGASWMKSRHMLYFFHFCGNLKTALIENSLHVARSSKYMRRYVKTPTIVSMVILSGSDMRENTHLNR